MSRRIVHVLVVTVAAVIASAAPADAASSTSASFNQDEVRIRSAPELNASINGLGYRNHKVTVWCETKGAPVDSNYYWFRLTDHTTGVDGYSSSRYVTIENVPPGC